MTTLMEREEQILKTTTAAPAADVVSPTVMRNRWIATGLFIAGLLLAIAGLGTVGTVAAALSLGIGSAMMVFDPASEGRFDRSGR